MSKNTWIGILVILVIALAGYYYFNQPAGTVAGLDVREEGGHQYLVNSDGQKVSDDFDSIAPLGENSAVGTVGDYKFLIIIEGDTARTATGGLDDVRLADDGQYLGTVGDTELTIDEDGTITSEVPDDVIILDYVDVVAQEEADLTDSGVIEDDLNGQGNLDGGVSVDDETQVDVDANVDVTGE